METAAVGSEAKRVIRSLAWRVPACLVLTSIGKYFISWATAVEPTNAKLIGEVLTVALAIVVAAIFVQPFLKGNRRR